MRFEHRIRRVVKSRLGDCHDREYCVQTIIIDGQPLECVLISTTTVVGCRYHTYAQSIRVTKRRRIDGERELYLGGAGRKRSRNQPRRPPRRSSSQIDVRRHEPRSSNAKREWRALRIHDSLNISIVSAVPGVREAERTVGMHWGRETHHACESLDAVENYNNCELT